MVTTSTRVDYEEMRSERRVLEVEELLHPGRGHAQPLIITLASGGISLTAEPTVSPRPSGAPTDTDLLGPTRTSLNSAGRNSTECLHGKSSYQGFSRNKGTCGQTDTLPLFFQTGDAGLPLVARRSVTAHGMTRASWPTLPRRRAWPW